MADPLDVIALLRVDDFDIEDFLLDIREEVEDDDSDGDDDDGWEMRRGTKYAPKKQKTGAMMQTQNSPTYVLSDQSNEAYDFGEA